MQAKLARHDTQLVELQNQVFLINDQHERERADTEARQTPPHLRIVKLEPRPAAPQSLPEVVDIELTGDSEPPRLTVAKVPPPAPAARATLTNAEADGAFRDAMRAFREGRGLEAAKSFARFGERYPSHTQTHMALFWAGEAYFEGGAFTEAVASFRRLLLRHPKSSKVADALFRMGTAYERLGEAEKARQSFADLVNNYPSSALADLARSRLGGAMGATR